MAFYGAAAATMAAQASRDHHARRAARALALAAASRLPVVHAAEPGGGRGLRRHAPAVSRLAAPVPRCRSRWCTTASSPPPAGNPVELRRELGLADGRDPDRLGRQPLRGEGTPSSCSRRCSSSRRVPTSHRGGWRSRDAGAKPIGSSSSPAEHGLDRVHFLGHRPDVPDILAAADVWVMPSLSEGLPLALLEAMFAGKAIVASSVGGIPEVIEPERDGLLVPPERPSRPGRRVGSADLDARLRAKPGARRPAEGDESVQRRSHDGRLRASVRGGGMTGDKAGTRPSLLAVACMPVWHMRDGFSLRTANLLRGLARGVADHAPGAPGRRRSRRAGRAGGRAIRGAEPGRRALEPAVGGGRAAVPEGGGRDPRQRPTRRGAGVGRRRVRGDRPEGLPTRRTGPDRLHGARGVAAAGPAPAAPAQG